MSKKPIIGILGGVSSGKSTAARLLGENHHCAVIDADRMAHEELEKPEIITQLVDAFGREILTDGRVDRARLAQAVFQNDENVRRINSIIHPPVLARTRELIARYRERSDVPAVVLDVPLLAETGFQNECTDLIFLDTDEAVRAQRMAKKGCSGKKNLKKREKFQISLDKKRNLSQYSINNNSDLSALAEQVARIFTKIVVS